MTFPDNLPNSPEPQSPSGSRENPLPVLTGNLATAISRYWFIVIPAILLNGVLAIDHVLAKHYDETFRVTLNNVELRAKQKQQADVLSETLRSHWIATNDDGNITGRISALAPDQSAAIPIARLDVTLLKKGEKIRFSATDDQGRFELEDVEPGVYTLVAAGQNGFLAYGVQVLPQLEEFDVLELDAQVDPASAKRRYYVSHFGIPEGVEIQEELQIDAAAVPPEFETLERISQNFLPSATALSVGRDVDDLKAIDKATNIQGGFQFPLDEAGNFNGRIQPIATERGEPAKLTEMNIFLIEDDLEVARVPVEENGDFKIEDVSPGVYSLVAAGKDGFAALSFELVTPDPETSEVPPEEDVGVRGSQRKTRLVSYDLKPARKAPVKMGIAIVTDPRDIQAIKQQIERISQLRNDLFNRLVNQSQLPGSFTPAQSFASPGVGSPAFVTQGIAPAPTGGGSVAAAGGGGRIGAGLALTAIAIAAVASGSDDDDELVPVDPGPQSPATTVQVQPPGFEPPQPVPPDDGQ